jgi:hypothetical protein
MNPGDILAADASRRAVLLVAHIRGVCRAPRALPAGRFDAHDATGIHFQTLNIDVA